MKYYIIIIQVNQINTFYSRWFEKKKNILLPTRITSLSKLNFWIFFIQLDPVHNMELIKQTMSNFNSRCMNFVYEWKQYKSHK